MLSAGGTVGTAGTAGTTDTLTMTKATVELICRMRVASGRVVRSSLTAAVTHHSLSLSLPYQPYQPFQPLNKVYRKW